jgi:hypothetical protein
MVKRLAVIACLLALALPAAAAAQLSPFGAGPQDMPVQRSPQQPAPAQSLALREDEGMPAWQQVLFIGIGVALIGGIAWVILRDARSRAPVEEAPGRDEARLRREEERRRRKQRARERARRARRSRKRNRMR